MGAMSGLAQRMGPREAVPYPGEHLGLHWRPLRPDDARGALALARIAEANDHPHRTLSPCDVADALEGGRGDELVETIVGLDADGRVQAAASVRVPRVREVAVAGVGAAIAPHWRGRGVGRALLYWQEWRVRQLLIDVHGADSELPVLVTGVVDSHLSDRRRLYIAAGFFALRTLTVFERELGGVDAVEPPDGYRLETWRWDLAARARRAHRAAFRADAEMESRSLERWHRALEQIEPRWSLVALAPDGGVAGYLLGVRPVSAWIRHGRLEADVSVLGVTPDHRGRGIGTALVREALRRAAAAGMTWVSAEVDAKGSPAAAAIFAKAGCIPQGSEVVYATMG